MDAFIGRWELDTSENFREYLKALGVGDEQASAVQVIKPTLIFCQDGEFVVIKTETSIFTEEVWFRLGEEYFQFTKDGRQCKNVVTLEGSKLVQVQNWGGRETTLVHEIKGEKMVVTLTFENTVATNTFQKV